MALDEKGREIVREMLAAQKRPKEIQAELANIGQTITNQGIHEHKYKNQHGRKIIESLEKQWLDKERAKYRKLWASSYSDLMAIESAALGPIIKKVNDKKEDLSVDEHDILMKGIKLLAHLNEKARVQLGKKEDETDERRVRITTIVGTDFATAIVELAERIRDNPGRYLEDSSGDNAGEEADDGAEEP